MIVDFRTRIDPRHAHDPRAGERLPGSTSTHAHEAAMQCVDVAVVVGERCDRLGHHITAESVADYVNQAPTRRVGFAGIDLTADSALDDVARAVDLSLAGVAVAPADQACRPTDERCFDLLEHAASRGLPVLVANPLFLHAESVLEYTRPSLLDEAASSIEGLTLILGDLGAGWRDETMLMLAKHARVFAVLSGVVRRPWDLQQTLLAAFERGVTDKLLFASGFPAETPERAIERIYTINGALHSSSMPTIPRRAIQSIVERDTLAVLGIDSVGVESPRRPAALAPASPILREEVVVVSRPIKPAALAD